MKVIKLFVFLIILTSCTQQKVYQIITKTPKIEYKKPKNFNTLSKFGKDAIYLVNIIETTYPKLYDKIPDFKEKSESFINKVAILENEKEFDIELKKFIAKLGDGHSNFQIDYNKYDKSFFHLYLFKQKNEWIIGNIDKKIDSSVIGSKIISINNLSISEIENRIRKFESGENDEWKFNQFLLHFAFPTYWQGLGVLKNEQKLNFKVEKKEGQIFDFSLEATSKKDNYKMHTKIQNYSFRFKQNNGFYNYFDKNNRYAYLQMNTSLDLECIRDGIDNYTNFITKPIAMAFLKKNKKNAKNFGFFLSAFFSKVHQKNIKNVILDLSYNTGGDERTGKQFIWYISKNKTISGFEETIKNSEYFKIQIKNDWKEYNNIYYNKYKTEMPLQEINITREFFNEPYFENITKNNSPLYLNNSIPKFDGKVYVIIGPNTFSAGQVLATTIADNKLAKLIGTPTGNKPSTQTGASSFKLPLTKKLVSLSYVYLERPDKSKNSENALLPDIEIYKTFQEFMNGEDKIMEYIIEDSKK